MSKTRLGKSSDPSLNELITRAKLAHESIHRDDSVALDRAMEAGDALIGIKARVLHGEWQTVLKSIGIPSSTARLYMQLARGRARIVAAGCKSIREARTLLSGTKPSRPKTTGARRGRQVSDRYEEGYADGYRAGRSAAQPRAARNGHAPASLDLKDLRWLITLAHPDKNQNELRATRVTQWLNELTAQVRKENR
jgi:hypothetical protein